MNNMSTSEGSSGSESGWTSYLDHTPTATAYQYDKSHWRSVGLNVDRQNQDTEDLSMVSDASSGPRYMYDGDNFSASASGLDQGKKKQKNQIKQNKLQVQDTYLDDTACSPVKVFFSVLNRPLSLLFSAIRLMHVFFRISLGRLVNPTTKLQ